MIERRIEPEIEINRVVLIATLISKYSLANCTGRRNNWRLAGAALWRTISCDAPRNGISSNQHENDGVLVSEFDCEKFVECLNLINSIWRS